MWLIGAGLMVLSLFVLAGLLGLLARRMPAGRGRELVALVPNCLVLLRRLRADKTLPLRARLALAAALAYLVSPIQLIPNFIPVLGYSDDLVVFGLAIRYACRRAGVEAVRGAWPGDLAAFERLLSPILGRGFGGAPSSSPG